MDGLNRVDFTTQANLNHAFMRSETATAIDFALYCERTSKGRRQVREVVLVNGYDFRSEQFQVETVFTLNQPKMVRELAVVGA